jgi:hypothetical protein
MTGQHSIESPHLLLACGVMGAGVCGHKEAKEETGFTAEGQAHGRPPGGEVTSFHTLSSLLPPLAQERLNPERARF